MTIPTLLIAAERLAKKLSRPPVPGPINPVGSLLTQQSAEEQLLASATTFATVQYNFSIWVWAEIHTNCVVSHDRSEPYIIQEMASLEKVFSTVPCPGLGHSAMKWSRGRSSINVPSPYSWPSFQQTSCRQLITAVAWFPWSDSSNKAHSRGDHVFCCHLGKNSVRRSSVLI